MLTAVEHLAGLVVGTVESVAPGEIRALLDLEAPSATALNAGAPAAFPRINGYALLPNEAGATVAYISWIGIERSPYPKRAGFKDFGLIDLPFPLRKMTLIPVGTLTTQRSSLTNEPQYQLERGVVALPSIGDQVLLPTARQVSAIVGCKDSDRRVKIGISPLALGAPIYVDPDKLFGRHLAILGNTGSGKSCTVAGLIRWSLDAAESEIRKKGDAAAVPNARFIVLDPNGEYARAFSDRGQKVRLFRVAPVSPNERPLDVPAWLWNGHEWTAVAHAQPGAQRPLLLQGLRELKSGNLQGFPRAAVIRRYLESYSIRITALLAQGTGAFAGSARARFACADMLKAIGSDAADFAQELENNLQPVVTAISTAANSVLTTRQPNPPYYNDFTVTDLESVRLALDGAATLLPPGGAPTTLSEDAPVNFDVTRLGEYLEQIATEQGGNLTAFTSTLRLRIRSMLSDPVLGNVINRQPAISFDTWLSDYIGHSDAAGGDVAIIDLSLLSSEIIHTVIAVLGRLIFEALQHYRRSHEEGLALPTVLVLEEAHTFVKRTREEDGAVLSSVHLCRETFEKIAREGRKFGLGLVLSSQRPSELSPTVLAQCNTFLLHRLVNDADQNLVARLVPDNVGALLRELPSLPSKQAILLGWATPIPVLLEVGELDKEHQPLSTDPDFWDVWTRGKPRPVDWASIVASWTAEAE